MDWNEVFKILLILIIVGFTSLWSFIAGFGKGYDAGVEDRDRYDDQV